MASFEDLPLDSGREDADSAGSSAPSSPGPRVVVTVLVAAAIASGTWYYLSRDRPTTLTTAAAAAAPAQSVAEPGVVTPVLPPLADMDPVVRDLLSGIGTHAPLLAWLATDDLVGSIATAVDRLAGGRSPARDLAVLRPSGPFMAVRRNAVMQVDARAYLRYDPLVRAAAAVDASKVAAAFTVLRPRLVEAWTLQGHAEGTFDDALARAIATVTATPDVPVDAALVPGAGGYAYADPAYERLPDAQKHLIRMGPEHVRLVRDAVKRFAAALPAATTR